MPISLKRTQSSDGQEDAYTNQSSPSWESQLTDSLLGDPSLSGVGEKCETRTPSSSPSHPLNGLAPLKGQ
jgi:hypothetical protein